MLTDTMRHKHIEASPKYKTDKFFITPISMQLVRTH